MRVLFMGTPDFAVPTLRALIKSTEEVIGVVTQPDRPKGRGKKLTPSPVKEVALSHKIPVFQPQKVKTPEFIEQLKVLNPDVIVVAAFGQILSKDILSLPPYGCINVHASLLPFYRGAAPIHWAVMNGEKETGITIMLMDEGLDTGDMLLQEKISIGPEDTTSQIHDQLAVLGANVLVETIKRLKNGTIIPTEQNHNISTYAPMLKKEHEKICWNHDAVTIHNQIRGLNAWPGAYTYFNGKRLKVWESRVLGSHDSTRLPGEVIDLCEQDGFGVQTGKDVLLILEVQPEGKQKMTGKAFERGYRIQVGDRMEEE